MKWQPKPYSLNEVHVVCIAEEGVKIVQEVFEADSAFGHETISSAPTPDMEHTPMDIDDDVDPKTSMVEEATDCCICMDECTNPKKLGCGHIFCTDCIEQQFKYKPSCPQCGAVFGKMYGNQPPGTVRITTSRRDLPGYYGDGSIEINYDIPAGHQMV